MKQCKACPWKKGTVAARDVPGGYCVDKHRALKGTISDGGVPTSGPLRMMACHESSVGADLPCVGWVVHQLGIGNNIALRLHALGGRFRDFRTVGPQHETFEATLGEHE